MIDATNQRLGRMASEIAGILMGKNTPEFQRNVAPRIVVTVEHAALLDINNKKLKEKKYMRYTGYPGGLKEEGALHRVTRLGYGSIVCAAVKGMLPKNKLQDQMMKHLVVTE